MVKFSSTVAFATAFLASFVLAHPGEHPGDDYDQRVAYLATQKRKDVAHCNAKEHLNDRAKGIMQRRMEKVENLRREEDLHHSPMLSERDIVQVLGKDHKSSQPYNASTPETTIFGSNSTCLLSPEIYEGPYYVRGELYRGDVTEGQAGIKNSLELQIVDKATCKPIPDAYVEIWSCNSTGVYGGVSSAQNGNLADTSNINKTFLRGVQKTDSDGVVNFKTLVPGHYAGRANHIHVVVHLGATLLPNNTLSGGRLSHIGQTYFDQSFLDQMEKTAPYSSNTVARTANAGDIWMIGGSTGDDPVWNYVFLGKAITDGIFSWMTMGVDVTAQRTISYAATYGEKGGVANNGGGGFPGFPGWPGWPPTTPPKTRVLGD